MIRNFRDKETQKVFEREGSQKLSDNIQKTALQKLVILDAAETLLDLGLPPSNHLEKLSGDREGQYSIRDNDQWRICFRWSGNEAKDVEITDYY